MQPGMDTQQLHLMNANGIIIIYILLRYIMNSTG